MYIVIEGQDGTGKSTQVQLLKEYFEKAGRTVVVMDEPDGDLPQAHDIHDLILVRGKDYNLNPLTNVLLFTAARLELWTKVAEPVLKAGGVVIASHNYWSTLVYQGHGEGVRPSLIKTITSLLPEWYRNPDVAVILTAPDSVRLARQGNRGKAVETFEAKPEDFQQRVNLAYYQIAEEFNVPIIHALGSVEDVFNAILVFVKNVFTQNV